MKHSVRFVLTLIVCLTMSLSSVMVGKTRAASTGWVERRPAGDVNLEWYALASDSTGTRVVAAAFGLYGTEGWVYTSTDRGATWTKRYPISASQFWRAAASDADGTNLIVGAWAGRLYTSADSGATWTERQSAGAIDQRWQTVASSADGSHLIAGASAGRLWISSNGGGTWTETRPAGNVDGDWRGASSSSDGSVMLVGNYGGRLYMTRNGGASWTEVTPAGAADKNWQGTAMDADGSNLITGVEGGRLYTSSNSGSSWTERQPVGDTNQKWSRFASDSDGKVLLASDESRLYSSVDSGATWVEQQPAGNADVHWVSSSIASDGSYFLVGAYGGRLYSLAVGQVPKQTVMVLQIGNSKFTVNGASTTLDSPPVIKNGRTLVPIRAIIEALGGTVGWDGTARKATVTLGSTTIELWIGKNAAKVNGVSKPIDSTNAKVVPEIINGRTMLPLRFVSENLGCSVVWAAATKTITITYQP
ncbi:stalk domain-containing protein [Candidatus Cryosericum hinesii]|jgi:photosystem II stability/assembly factor-like uncharacterized protein|nr:stalk domain-containing protein [Candidatus Cryosericum hinesii]